MSGKVKISPRVSLNFDLPRTHRSSSGIKHSPTTALGTSGVRGVVYDVRPRYFRWVPSRFYSTDANRYSISRRVLQLVRRTLHERKHLAIGAASPVVSARRVISPFTCSTAAGRSARQTLWLLASLEEALWSERAAPRSVRTSRLTKRSVRTSRAQGPDLRRRRRWGPPPECLLLPGDAQLAARTTAAKRVALVPVPACR